MKTIYEQPDRFPLLIASFCRSICGRTAVKAGLLLGMAGGVAEYTSDRKAVRRRGDIHVLLLGDPGLGKSQLLRAAAAMSPRGVYVSGNSASLTGLTCSVVREPTTGDFALEGGALVLADQGICCVDEFDKMGGDQQALLEAMEQQTVSIAKAGIVCNLQARASVIVAANPRDGSFVGTKTIEENLKGVMSNALLSRFDLVFLLQDQADQDVGLSDHVLGMRAGGGGGDWMATVKTPLEARCRDVQSPLPAQLLRTYLQYARAYVHPVLTRQAKERLKSFFLELRSGNHELSGRPPVTTRQLEALIRLSQARARLELDEEVTEEHVEDVIELVKEGVLYDPVGEASLVAIAPGAAPSKGGAAGKVRKFIAALEKRATRTGDREFQLSDLKALASNAGIANSDFDGALGCANESGALLKEQGGGYRLA
mmetsp:Transcript_138241/g.311480  ORF Transcript_138241/g.311480 Transcript_138241/m.311480 type:complete len:427 (-) Transcript_138241:138-1418(-)